MTGDGTSNDHLRVMHEKGLAYAMAIRNSTIQRGECIHQINNARSKLKDVVNTAIELRTQFEVDLAMAVVEQKRPEFRSGEIFMECDKDILVQKELKSR
jgi:hypothetical protein